MSQVSLFRPKDNCGANPDHGTFGRVIVNGGDWSCFSGELPARGNQSKISRIPAGDYLCRWIDSPVHGLCYQVMDVPNRSMIEIHSANWMGDASLGFFCQLLGCIALGKSVGKLDAHPDQMALQCSSITVQEFNRRMAEASFTLSITDEK